MVPEGWERQPIKNICESIIDCVNKTAKTVDYSTPYKMIRTTNVRHGRVDTDNVRYVTEEVYKEWIRRGAPKDGDLIFTREAPVGEVGILIDSKGIFLGQRTMMYRAHLDKSDNYFLHYSLQSSYCQKQIENFSNGGTVAHMRVPDCGMIIINIPPLPEQKKIAKILSIWDKAIETVEKLIENSHAQKKALMQQLLTGKKRFAGFEGEWENKKLNDVYNVIDSLHQTPKFSDEGYPMVRVTDVKGGVLSLDNTVKVSPEVFTKYTKKYLPKKHDIIFSRVGSYGISSYVNTTVPFCLGQNTVIAESSDKADSKYIFNVLKSVFIKKQIERTVDGSSHKTVSLKIIRNLDIPFPSIQEQQRIASVLTKADKEIELLEQQLSDLKQEKKALMQQLLTGKRRVAVATTSEVLC